MHTYPFFLNIYSSYIHVFLIFLKTENCICVLIIIVLEMSKCPVIYGQKCPFATETSDTKIRNCEGNFNLEILDFNKTYNIKENLKTQCMITVSDNNYLNSEKRLIYVFFEHRRRRI